MKRAIALIGIAIIILGGLFLYKNHSVVSIFHHTDGNTEELKGMDQMAMPGVKIQTTFENDKVKIVHYHFDAHATIPMHNAPDLVAVWLTDGHLKLTAPDGTSKKMSVKKGQAEYEPAESHAGENLSDSPLDFISVQLKRTTAHVTPNPTNGENMKSMDEMSGNGLSVKTEFANDELQIERFRVDPGGTIPWHTPPAGVQVQLTNGKLRISFENGKSIDADLKAGTAVWFESMRHMGKNIGDTPIEFVSVQLK